MSGKIPSYRPGLGKSFDLAEAERKRFYNGKRWKEKRLQILRKSPLCEECAKRGLVVEATTVHHRIDRLKRPELAYETSNLASVCAACHTRHHKTRRANDGLG